MRLLVRKAGVSRVGGRIGAAVARGWQGRMETGNPLRPADACQARGARSGLSVLAGFKESRCLPPCVRVFCGSFR
ncbi:hypothetical protein GCM10027398_16430 [Azotobacter salinestris]